MDGGEDRSNNNLRSKSRAKSIGCYKCHYIRHMKSDYLKWKRREEGAILKCSECSCRCDLDTMMEYVFHLVRQNILPKTFRLICIVNMDFIALPNWGIYLPLLYMSQPS